MARGTSRAERNAFRFVRVIAERKKRSCAPTRGLKPAEIWAEFPSYRAESAPPSFVPCSSFCVHHSPLRVASHPSPRISFHGRQTRLLARKLTPGTQPRISDKTCASGSSSGHHQPPRLYLTPGLFFSILFPFRLSLSPSPSPSRSSRLASFFDPTRFVRITQLYCI